MKAFKVYAIAEEHTACHGHGDYRTSHHIAQVDISPEPDFPPIFHTHQDAEQWLKDHSRHYYFSNPKVVKLTLLIPNVRSMSADFPSQPNTSH